MILWNLAGENSAYFIPVNVICFVLCSIPWTGFAFSLQDWSNNAMEWEWSGLRREREVTGDGAKWRSSWRWSYSLCQCWFHCFSSTACFSSSFLSFIWLIHPNSLPHSSVSCLQFLSHAWSECSLALVCASLLPSLSIELSERRWGDEMTARKKLLCGMNVQREVRWSEVQEKEMTAPSLVIVIVIHLSPLIFTHSPLSMWCVFQSLYVSSSPTFLFLPPCTSISPWTIPVPLPADILSLSCLCTQGYVCMYVCMYACIMYLCVSVSE